MDFFKNLWVIGILTGIISGVITFFVTGFLVKREIIFCSNYFEKYGIIRLNRQGLK